jgi:putative ABC transport system substrate-binding protein
MNRLQRLAKEIVAVKPDVIFSSSSSPTRILKQETSTIPIIFGNVVDPVGQGLITSMARPGSNMTGFANFEGSMGGKWVELLKEITPNVARSVVLMHPEIPPHAAFWRAVQSAAPSFGVKVTPAHVRGGNDVEHAITTFAPQANGGVIVFPHPIMTANRNLIVELAARYRLPAIYPLRFFSAAGGLLSYGIDQVEQWRPAASYVDRILRGEKPTDLPVQAPDKFELVINLKTAKALGLDVPWILQQRADEVIE